MGTYTGLRIKVVVKEEYREMIEEINSGSEWAEFTTQFPFLERYAQQHRAEFIPRGVLSYMPSHWEEGEFPNQGATEGFERNIVMDTGYWTFQCSLKNYEGEIQLFFKDVLGTIISGYEHIEYQEENSSPKFFELADGRIVPSN